MTVSPRFEDRLLVTLAVTLDGEKLPDHAVVSSVEIDAEVNRIPQARLRLLDGDRAAERFAWSESDLFTPGAEIRISAGYRNAADLLFEGVVARHGLRVDPEGGTYLELTCFDPAFPMTMGRSSAQDLGKSDAEILSALIADAGLSADVPASDVVPEATVRHEATDWDFILMRAAALGRVVIASGGTVRVVPPDLQEPRLVLRLGDAIEGLELDLDGASQPQPPSAASWDPATQEVVQATAAETGPDEPGNLGGPDLAEALGLPAPELRSFAGGPRDALAGWAEARLLQARLARVRGRATLPGTARLRPGDTVEFAGLGPRVDGRAYVSGVRHRLAAGLWRTEAQIGLDPLEGAARLARIPAPPAGGLRPPMRGLQIAKVVQIHDDPAGERRVKVTLPLARGQSEGIWVRNLCAYATDGAGAVFLPEPGDEVVLGFLDADPQSGILLGALQSSARPAPYSPEAGNEIKAIVTKGQIRIEMQDTDKIVTIATPGGQVLTLSDKASTVRAEDSNGNSVELSPSGIALETPGDLSISATGKVSIEGQAGIDLSSPADVSVTGLNVTVEGNVGATVKGGATAELSAGAQTTVKGAMVMIN